MPDGSAHDPKEQQSRHQMDEEIDRVVAPDAQTTERIVQCQGGFRHRPHRPGQELPGRPPSSEAGILDDRELIVKQKRRR